MPQVLASHCCTKVVTISLLATMYRQGLRFDVTCRCFVVNGRWQRLPTKLWRPQIDYRRPQHGMETSKKWGLRSPTKSERNHNELFCRHQIFNMLKICQRTRLIISVVCGRYRIRQRQLTATHDDWRQIQNCNSQLNVPCRYPLFAIVWARLSEYMEGTYCWRTRTKICKDVVKREDSERWWFCVSRAIIQILKLENNVRIVFTILTLFPHVKNLQIFIWDILPLTQDDFSSI